MYRPNKYVITNSWGNGVASRRASSRSNTSHFPSTDTVSQSTSETPESTTEDVSSIEPDVFHSQSRTIHKSVVFGPDGGLLFKYSPSLEMERTPQSTAAISPSDLEIPDEIINRNTSSIEPNTSNPRSENPASQGTAAVPINDSFRIPTIRVPRRPCPPLKKAASQATPIFEIKNRERRASFITEADMFRNFQGIKEAIRLVRRIHRKEAPSIDLDTQPERRPDDGTPRLKSILKHTHVTERDTQQIPISTHENLPLKGAHKRTESTDSSDLHGSESSAEPSRLRITPQNASSTDSDMGSEAGPTPRITFDLEPSIAISLSPEQEAQDRGPTESESEFESEQEDESTEELLHLKDRYAKGVIELLTQNTEMYPECSLCHEKHKVQGLEYDARNILNRCKEVGAENSGIQVAELAWGGIPPDQLLRQFVVFSCQYKLLLAMTQEDLGDCEDLESEIQLRGNIETVRIFLKSLYTRCTELARAGKEKFDTTITFDKMPPTDYSNYACLPMYD